MRKQIPRPRLQGAPESSAGLCWHPATPQHVLSIPAAPPPRDTSHGQESSGCFSFREEKAVLAGEVVSLEPDTAHPAPCFTRRHKASTAVPPWSINQEPNYSNLWLVFQGQQGAAVAQHCAKSSSNTRHKPLQFGMISQHPCEPGFPQPGDLLRYQPAERGDKSLHQQNLRTCSVSK